MQRDREQFWLIAACVVAAHAVALVAVTTGWFFWWSKPLALATSQPVDVAVADPVVRLKEVEPPEREPDLGEAHGLGDSIATIDLPHPTVSDKPDAFEQAWTRQKPAPLPRPAAPAQVEAQQRESESAAEPKEASKATSEFGPLSVTALSPLTVRVPESPKEGKSVEPPTEPQAEHAKPEQKEVEQKEVEQAKAQEQPAEPTPLKQDQPAKPAEPQQASVEKPDPAPKGDSDLDPFAKEESVSFTPGGTSARRGREVKIARPRIELGFLSDASRLSGHDLVIRMSIETDNAGRPRDVQVIDSSGSDTIDDAVRLAMYDSWFGGKMPDRFPFTVRFVRR